MIAAAVLAALAMGCVLAAKRLTAAKWTHRAPHIGILLWQAIGVAWGLATIGALLAFALEPYGKGVFYGMAAMVTAPEYGGVESPHDVARLTALVLGLALLAVLIAVPIVAAVQTLRARRRHRDLLALIAREDPSVPGVRVVDFPAAAAYCVPGLKSQVVISDECALGAPFTGSDTMRRAPGCSRVPVSVNVRAKQPAASPTIVR